MIATLPPSSTPALAKTKIVAPFSVATWEAGQLHDERTNEFFSCFAYGSYKSGITLYVFIYNDWSWMIGLSNSAWSFPTRTIDVSYKYDGGAWLKVQGKVDEDMIQLYMPSERTAAELFQASKVLEVMVAGQRYGFELSGTRRMFDALLNCVSNNVPSSTSQAQTPTPKVSNDSSEVVTTPIPKPAPNETAKAPDIGGPSFGTGFFVSPNRIITNQHVIEGCEDVKVISPSEGTLAATVLRSDKINDLAVLKTVGASTGRSAAFRQSGLRVGEQVAVFGYPLAGTLSTSGSLTSGNISSLAGMGDDVRQFQISAPIQPGNSGGPLLDMSGNVIGITNMKLNEMVMAQEIGSLPQNVNFAIKSSVVLNFLDAHAIPYDAKQSSEALSLPDVVDRAKEFTVQIFCR